MKEKRTIPPKNKIDIINNRLSDLSETIDEIRFKTQSVNSKLLQLFSEINIKTEVPKESNDDDFNKNEALESLKMELRDNKCRLEDFIKKIPKDQRRPIINRLRRIRGWIDTLDFIMVISRSKPQTTKKKSDKTSKMQRFRELTVKEESEWLWIYLRSLPEISDNEERLRHFQELILIGHAMNLGYG